uniref:Appetite-regulating hormone n=1 Tax=Equus caballus TaxID=9796 RepID=A0A5F5PHE9_HORSE
MPSRGTICSLLLLSVLWVDLTMAGSSFLSPEHHKVQHRKESKKPPAKLKPRALEDWLPSEDGGQAQGAEEELEIRRPRMTGDHPHDWPTSFFSSQ